MVYLSCIDYSVPKTENLIARAHEADADVDMLIKQTDLYFKGLWNL